MNSQIIVMCILYFGYFFHIFFIFLIFFIYCLEPLSSTKVAIYNGANYVEESLPNIWKNRRIKFLSHVKTYSIITSIEKYLHLNWNILLIVALWLMAKSKTLHPTKLMSKQRRHYNVIWNTWPQIIQTYRYFQLTFSHCVIVYW